MISFNQISLEEEGPSQFRCNVRTRKIIVGAYLFLLHELRVRNIISNTGAKDGRSQDSVDIFSIDVSKLGVQDKSVAFWAKTDGHPFAKQNKGEDVSVLQCNVSGARNAEPKREMSMEYLLLAVRKKLERIHTICNCTSKNRQVMEHNGWFIWIFEKDLSENVRQNDEPNEKGCKNDGLDNEHERHLEGFQHIG